MRLKSYKLNSTDTYIVAWIIAQISVLLASSEIAYTAIGGNTVRYITYVIAAVFLSAKMIILDKYKVKTLFLIVASIVLIGLVSYHALGFTLILHGIFLVSLKSVDINRLIRTDMNLRIFVTAILFLLSILGIINNYSATINGNLKYAFGWLHPNTFAFQIIIIILEYIYTSRRKMKLKGILAIVLTLIILWVICASRTTIYAFVLFLLVYFMIYNGTVINHKCFRLLLCSIMPICAIVSWGLVFLFQLGNNFAIKMNSILTSRLVYSARFLETYPMTLWGNKIYTVSTREHYLLGVRTEILDMSYIRLPLEYGIVFCIVFIVLNITIQLLMVNSKRYIEASVIFFFSLLGITSTGLLSPFTNFSLLFITFLMEKREDHEKQIHKKTHNA